MLPKQQAKKKSAASTNKAANQNPENVSGNIVENVFNIKEVQPSQASVDVEVDNVFKIKDIKQRKPVSDIAKSSTAKSAPKQARAKLPTGKKSKAPIPAGTKPEDGMQGNTDNQVEVLSSIAREVPDNVFKITQIEQGELSASLPIADELPGVPTSSVRLKKITFQLKFHTHIGQLVYVTGNHAVLGNNDFSQGFALTYLNDEYWVGTLTLPDNETLQTDLNYQYYLKENGAFISEWGQDKVIQPATLQAEEILLIDSWNPASLIENTFYTEPFQQVLLKRDFTERNDMVPEIVTHTFKVKAPLLGSDQALCITGSIAELGGWSYSAPIFLSRKAGEVWHSIDLDLSEANFPLSYKYALYDKTTQRVTTFETGENRTVYDSYSAGKHVVVSDGFAQLPFTPFKGAGVAIPVFSLRSQQSFGVGEFNDLKLMIDWAKQANFKLVQLLPVNDTTATHSYLDSYPYAAISAFALHPLYLHLPNVVTEQNKHLYADLQQKQQELNAKGTVDYVEVMREKWNFIKQVFPLQKDSTFADAAFKDFFDENDHWLIPYAAFSYLREKNNTSAFNNWSAYQVYNAQQVKELAGDYLSVDNEISVYYFVQYHLHCQLRAATNYAHENGIIIKGDIPIGIYRNSCDAWQEPDLFYMDMQAGAPPTILQ